MEKAEYNVIFLPKAQKSIYSIFCYIAKQGSPGNASRFFHQLYDFGNSLYYFPNKFPICNQLQFAKRNMHCAPFHKNYVFVYKFIILRLHEFPKIGNSLLSITNF